MSPRKLDGEAGASPKKIKVQQVRGVAGYPRVQREVLRTLGLRRIRHVVEREDSAAVRGAIRKISHLVRIVDEANSSDGK